MNEPVKRKLTPAFIFFYILFSPDTWRTLMGVLLALVFTPHILPANFSMGGSAMLYVMVAAIGWALSAKPANLLTDLLKKLILQKG